MEYVRQLRLSSANWRSAFELASLIQNDAKLASDPKLLGELTDLLSSELKHNENPRLTQYCRIMTLGAFQTPGRQPGRRPQGRPDRAARPAPSSRSSRRRSGSPRRPAWPSRRRGCRASSRTRARSRRWPRRPPEMSPSSARWPSMRWVSSAARRPRKALRERLAERRRPLRPLQRGRGPGPPRRHGREGHLEGDALHARPRSRHRASERDREAEQDRGHRARGPPGVHSSLSSGSTELARSLRPEIEEPDALGPGERPEPGPGGLAKITIRPLIDSRGPPAAFATSADSLDIAETATDFTAATWCTCEPRSRSTGARCAVLARAGDRRRSICQPDVIGIRRPRT